MSQTGNAIIGLGSMGIGMARNVMAAGIKLAGYDINPVARETFADAGGQAHASAMDAAKGADLLIVMVVNAEQADMALFGDGGGSSANSSGSAAAAMKPGGTVILCSTVAPSEARALAEKAESLGLRFLDAPVSGGKVGADEGTLTVMASGPEDGFSRAEGVLDAISNQVYRLGNEPGLGATYKVVHQLAAGVHLVAAAELMALGVNSGCDAQVLYDIVSNSAGKSWMYNDRVPRILEGDFVPRSMVDIFIKDLGLVLQTGNETKTPLPLSAAAHQMLVAASSMGHGQLDDSAVVKAYEAITGVPVKSKGGS